MALYLASGCKTSGRQEMYSRRLKLEGRHRGTEGHGGDEKHKNRHVWQTGMGKRELSKLVGATGA